MAKTPIKSQSYTQLLTNKAQNRLEYWQCNATQDGHFDRERRAQVCESLRNLKRSVDQLPTYTEHLLRNPKMATGPRGNALFQFSKKNDYIPPLRRTHNPPEDFGPFTA